MDITFHTVSWTKYQSYAQKLAATILSHEDIRIDEIIAISRGGLALGRIMADLLAKPISTITIQSFTDIQSQGELHICEELKKPINGRHILLIDDVADSGKTFVRALEYLKGFSPASITTVSMFYKVRSVYRPDSFAEQSNAWIIFPYEVAETITLLSKKLIQEGKSKAEIQEFLMDLGFLENQIAFVRKYHLKTP